MIKKETIRINGMSCSHCVKSVENEISKLPAIRYRVEIGLMDIEYDESTVMREQIVNAVEAAGYEVVE
jgi:copper chaperone